MKAPKKNIMNLEDDSPEIISNESEQLPEPLINKEVENSEEVQELNSSEKTMKRFVLEDDEITNDTQESENTQQIDGKVRFLLEDDDISNVGTDLNRSDSTQVLDTDLMTANEEEKIVGKVESKAISDERLERIRKATEKLRSPLGLKEMESEPAYKRRNVELKDVKYSDDLSSSRYTFW